jgi:hypothetical protein
MKLIHAAVAVVAVAISAGSALIEPAHAAPPTVTPSPGYDARLQEQRLQEQRLQEQRMAPIVYQPAPRAFHRHHHPKRIHDGAH